MDTATRMRRRELAKRRVQRQRRIAAGATIGLFAIVLAIVVLGSGGSSKSSADQAKAAKARKPAAPAELPRGGREIFPEFRVVAFYGAPQDDELGELGIGKPADVARKLEGVAKRYKRGGRPLLPAFELISTVASGAPGDDGRYSYRQPTKVIDKYLKAARAAKAILVLDIQPGHVDFMTDVEALRPYLEQPDVSLALDPEWHTPGAIPGQVIGSVDASVVNEVSRYLSSIVSERKLPQKLLVVHQFTDDMIHGKEQLKQSDGVALTLNVDGFGDQPNKVSKYVEFARGQSGWHHGFKLFYREDTNLMTPRQVLRLRPQPELVVYE